MRLHLLTAHKIESKSQPNQSQSRGVIIRKVIKKNGDVLLYCKKCGVMMKESLMESHMKSHSDTQSIECPLCPFLFFSRNILLKHHFIKNHPENYEPVNQFICTKCKELAAFNTIDELRLHIEGAHRISKIKKCNAQEEIK